MRAAILVAATLVAGCSFDVIGTNVDPAGAPTPPSPTQSVPNGSDAGAPTTQPPPPSTGGADMAAQRVGTPCTADAECDPGLFCAKTFGTGPGHVDIPGGYCTVACPTDVCPANSICVAFSFGKYCSSACPPDPCRTSSGYVCCDEGGGQKACTPTMLCAKKDG